MSNTRATILAAAGLVVLAGCGPEVVPAVPTIPRNIAAGPASSAEELDVETVAAAALDPSELVRVLEEAGFLTGAQRTFSGGAPIRVIVARILVFGSDDGAQTYLGWVRSNASDLIGAVQTRESMALGGSSLPVFIHLPGGCCPKSTPIYLAAWREGARVFSIVASGPGANPAAFRQVATTFDRAV